MKFNIFFVIVLMFSIILNIFMLIDIIPINNNSERTLDGLWLHNYNYSEAIEEVNKRDNTGDWVFINIKDMDYPRAYEVCVHECSHQAFSEIFAEKCEKDISKCMEIINGTK